MILYLLLAWVFFGLQASRRLLRYRASSEARRCLREGAADRALYAADPALAIELGYTPPPASAPPDPGQTPRAAPHSGVAAMDAALAQDHLYGRMQDALLLQAKIGELRQLSAGSVHALSQAPLHLLRGDPAGQRGALYQQQREIEDYWRQQSGRFLSRL